MSDLPPAFVKVIEEITAAVRTNKPDDVYQFISNFMHKKLEIQRAQLVAIAKGYQAPPTSTSTTAQPSTSLTPATDPQETRSHASATGSQDSDDDDADYQDPIEYDDSGDSDMDSDAEEDDVVLSLPPNMNRGRRTSVSAESMAPTSASKDFTKIVIPKTDEQRKRIDASIRTNFLFKNLDEEQYQDVVDAMAEKRVANGETVIKQGGIGDYFYVVETGTLDVFVTRDPTTLGIKVTDYTTGGSFGELALMYNAPRAATIISTSDCILWALDRMSFRRILMERTSRKRRMYERFLEEVPLLMSLEPYERSKIADALDTVAFDAGEFIIKQGDVGDNFYLIESGEATILKKDEHGVEHNLGVLKKGDYFGELALLTNKPRAATIVAKDRIKLANLNKKAFTRLLGPVVDIIKRNASNYQKVSGELDH